MTNNNAPLDPAVQEVLRAYVDAIMLAEPLQLRLWTSAGVTLTQLRILRVLREGQCSASELAHRAGLSAPSLTRVLDRLEELHRVARIGDPSDRRRVTVQILPEGQRLLGDQRIWRNTPFADAAHELAPEEREAFIRSIRRFSHAVLRAQERAGESATPTDG